MILVLVVPARERAESALLAFPQRSVGVQAALVHSTCQLPVAVECVADRPKSVVGAVIVVRDEHGGFSIGLEHATREVRTARDAAPAAILMLEQIELRMKDAVRVHDKLRARVLEEGFDEVGIGLVEVHADGKLLDLVGHTQE